MATGAARCGQPQPQILLCIVIRVQEEHLTLQHRSFLVTTEPPPARCGPSTSPLPTAAWRWRAWRTWWTPAPAWWRWAGRPTHAAPPPTSAKQVGDKYFCSIPWNIARVQWRWCGRPAAGRRWCAWTRCTSPRTARWMCAPSAATSSPAARTRGTH